MAEIWVTAFSCDECERAHRGEFDDTLIGTDCDCWCHESDDDPDNDGDWEWVW